MKWKPTDQAELEALISNELANCSEELRQLFTQVQISVRKWQLSPWGDAGGGFWVVAIHGDRVLWYNDIEEGFNVSQFEVTGQIPECEYWCNQDTLCWVLPRLTGDFGPQAGPPEPQKGAEE